jgi:nucleotide-binding universal stress UspA family protein
VLVHAVDDDQPERLAQSAAREARSLMVELVETIAENDAVQCEGHVVSGSPDEAVTTIAEDRDFDLVVTGAHRVRPFHDLFLGTTVDRILRRSRRPVLVARTVPAGRHHHALFATDMSAGASAAIAAARALGLLDDTRLSVLHVFAAPGQELMLHASASTKEVTAYVENERQKADRALQAHLSEIGVRPDGRLVELVETATADTVVDSARGIGADLIVIGSQGRSSLGRFILGSMAQGVLRAAACDVLVVPNPE